MSIIARIILGLIAGFIASKIVNRRGEGVILDIVLGIIGAVVGGCLFHAFGSVGVTGFNIYSLLVAIVGAIVVLVIYHAIAASVGDRNCTEEASMARKPLLPILLCASVLALVACEQKGPAERAGEKIDHTVDTIRNGGEEPTHDKLQHEADKARSKINHTADDVEKGPP